MPTDKDRDSERCVDCGYTLTGVRDDRCPECGNLRRLRSDRRVIVSLWTTVMLIGAAVLIAHGTLQHIADEHFNLQLDKMVWLDMGRGQGSAPVPTYQWGRAVLDRWEYSLEILSGVGLLTFVICARSNKHPVLIYAQGAFLAIGLLLILAQPLLRLVGLL